MGQASTPSGLRTMSTPYQVGPASTHALQPPEDIPCLTDRTSLHPDSGGCSTLTGGFSLHILLPLDDAHALPGRTRLHPSDSGGYSTLTDGFSLHTLRPYGDYHAFTGRTSLHSCPQPQVDKNPPHRKDLRPQCYNVLLLCAKYNLELPPTLYGEDLLNGNDLMTQSMDPSFLSSRLDNTDPGNHFLYFR
jgi:hypothetical protein